jgi:hypothetical protein
VDLIVASHLALLKAGVRFETAISGFELDELLVSLSSDMAVLFS